MFLLSNITVSSFVMIYSKFHQNQSSYITIIKSVNSSYENSRIIYMILFLALYILFHNKTIHKIETLKMYLLIFRYRNKLSIHEVCAYIMLHQNVFRIKFSCFSFRKHQFSLFCRIRTAIKHKLKFRKIL